MPFIIGAAVGALCMLMGHYFGWYWIAFMIGALVGGVGTAYLFSCSFWEK